MVPQARHFKTNRETRSYKTGRSCYGYDSLGTCTETSGSLLLALHAAGRVSIPVYASLHAEDKILMQPNSMTAWPVIFELMKASSVPVELSYAIKGGNISDSEAAPWCRAPPASSNLRTASCLSLSINHLHYCSTVCAAGPAVRKV